MKIKQEHYQLMCEALQKVLADNPGAFEMYQKEGLSVERFNWDVFRASSIKIYDKNTKPNIMHKYCLPLYDYLNDSHIYTAIKNITGKG